MSLADYYGLAYVLTVSALIVVGLVALWKSGP